MRAYEAEDRAFGPAWSAERTAAAMDLHDARMVARTLCDEFGVDQIQVDRSRANATRSMFWYPYGSRPARIRLLPTADVIVVCHEVAHWVAWSWGMPKGHGREWATIYLRAVSLMVDYEHEDRLRAAFEAVGLLTPEEATT